jgi:hypothetical protein
VDLFHKLPMNSDTLGQCRPVSDFKKLNRIGEGTYGMMLCFILLDLT